MDAPFLSGIGDLARAGYRCAVCAYCSGALHVSAQPYCGPQALGPVESMLAGKHAVSYMEVITTLSPLCSSTLFSAQTSYHGENENDKSLG